MKILYLIYFSLENTKFLGVRKKILGQVKGLEKLQNNVDIGYCHNNKFIILNNGIKKEINCKKGFDNYRGSVYKIFKENDFNYDAVYIRFPGSIDYYLYKLTCILKEKNIKCILEIPTYPFDGEIKESINFCKKEKRYLALAKIKIKYFIHSIFEKKMKSTNIKIVTFMPVEKIWDINTIVIDNGIDIDKNQMVKPSNEAENKNQFNILIVANMNKWHGIDRAIQGMKEYLMKWPSNPRNVKIIIAGSGKVEKELKELVIKEKLSEYVIFKGLLEEKELNKLYEKATIALGSLGLHRIGLEEGSTLKLKEYCAKGIPFVIGYKERELDTSFKYVLQVPASESPINIEECIRFFDAIKKSNYRLEMHEFAEKKYDWKIQMKNVLEKI